MTGAQITLRLWLALLTILWSVYPLLFSHVRLVGLLAVLTMALASSGWMSGYQPLVVWSGIVGLANITLSLMLAGHPPNFWVGMSAGLTVFALFDGSHTLAYVRHCHLQPGVLSVVFATWLRLCGWSLGVGLSMTVLLVALYRPAGSSTTAGLLTILGAVLFLGAMAVFILYASTLRNPDV